MGTTPQGKRPQNDITISRSNTNKSVDPLSGKSTVAGPGTADAVKQARDEAMPERSFAQPSPVAQPKAVAPKTHASEEAQKDALTKNSLLKKLPEVEVEPEQDETKEDGDV